MASTIAEDFDPSRLASEGPPVFVRKVSRRRHWRGGNGMSVEERIKQAAKEVFPNDEGRVSVFRVETVEDLQRVTIGLNSGRASLNEQLDLLGITPEDINACGLTMQQTPGDTACNHANGLHYDIDHDETGIKKLVRRLIDNERWDDRFTTTQMNRAVEAAREIGCHGTESTRQMCQCEGC